MLISVCIPAYNGEKYIRQAIDSIINQSYRDFELIILDDNSVDNTTEIVSYFDDPRIRLIKNKKRLGLVNNWNACVELANGEYVYLMHQDDVMMPNNLLKKKIFLEENNRLGFVHSNILTINHANDVVGGHWMENKLPNRDQVYIGIDFFKYLALASGNFVCCPTVMFKKVCWECLGGFDSRLPFTVDMEMWLRISTQFDVAYIADPLLYYRKHDEQETQRFSKMGKEIYEVERAIEIAIKEHLGKLVVPGLLYQARRNLITHSIGMSKWKFKKGYFLESISYLSTAMSIAHKNMRDRWDRKVLV